MTIRYPFRVVLFSPLAVGAGLADVGVDDTVPRWHDGSPYLPATMLKGAARDALRISDAPPHLRSLLGTPDEAAGAAIVSDALAPNGHGFLVAEVSTVALDERRTPLTGALTSVEVIEPWTGDRQRTVFEGQVIPSPTAPADRALAAAGALLAGLASIRSLGRRTSRGWGQVRVALAPDSAERATDAVRTGAPA